MTDGMLLREAISDPVMKRLEHITSASEYDLKYYSPFKCWFEKLEMIMKTSTLMGRRYFLSNFHPIFSKLGQNVL
jgi:hypothetical protein